MRRRLLPLFIYLILFVVSLGADAYGASSYLIETRGVEPRTAGVPSAIIGTNTSLGQYEEDADLERALALVGGAHLTMIRQHFPWRQIESAPGQYDWAKWDHLVAQVRAANLQILAVLDTAPAWAQRENERDLPNAPPNDFEGYARFAGAFARRYAGQITYFEIWDEPNVHPSWGRRNADPVEYGRLLHAAAVEIRAKDVAAKIVLAGLATNVETLRPHPDYSDVLFLRGLYEAGAQNDFDIVAAKPYGMWTGPEDRRVSPDVLNFSRVILLREEMKQHGDVAKPLWAVEMGWNALGPDWQGKPSPWGSDQEPLQGGRLERAFARSESEWPWMGGLFPQLLQPDAAPDDPRWGFSLITSDSKPRGFYTVLSEFLADPPPAVPAPSTPWVAFAMLTITAAVAGWRGARLVPWTLLTRGWLALAAAFSSQPEPVRFAILAAAVAALYVSPWVPLNFVLLAILAPLFALQLDLGLAILVFSIPFFLFPKTLFGGFNLSMVEMLTLVSVVAWAIRATLGGGPQLPRSWRDVRERIAGARPLDWAVLLFVILGLVSIRVAANTGVATREFRVIVVEPALVYFLLRATDLSRQQLAVLVNALIAAGVAVCAIGFIQMARGDVIAAQGTVRIHSVWESPNNAALFLGRVLPLGLALALCSSNRQSRLIYSAITVVLAVTVYLTISFGALFFGVPASVGFVLLAWLARRRIQPRVALATGAVLLVLALAVVVPLSGTQRFQDLFRTGTGTGFFRVAVWTSAVNMIRDHPIFGVGLDNFLYEYPKYILPEAWREPNLSHPHNVLLDFWVRMGLLGAVVLAWIEVEFFRRGWRSYEKADSPIVRGLLLGLMGSMVDFLAHGLVDAAYFVVDLAFVFMLTVGLLSRLTNVK